MLIINADDWGRSRFETDVAKVCYERAAITSVSAMVFMDDSERAAEIAREFRVDTGIHVNFTQDFTGKVSSRRLSDYQKRIARFLNSSKYALLFYHPLLRKQFRYVYEAQLEEFVRLYGTMPSHVDGHQHMHLCSNVLIDGLIPREQKVRRSFSFSPGEKSALNRGYRNLVDKWLGSRYCLTDFFFSLEQCLRRERFARVVALAKTANVEVMTHPGNPAEYRFLMNQDYRGMVVGLRKGSYAVL